MQTIILTKNSPLTPMYNLGYRQLREMGTLDNIYLEWEGKGVVNRVNVASKTVLAPGQVQRTLHRITKKSTYFDFMWKAQQCCSSL